MSDPSKPDEVVDKPLVEPSQATVPAEDSKPSVQLDAEKIDSEKSTQSIPKVTIEETPQAAAPPHIEPVAATGPSVSFALTSDKKSEAVLPTVTAPKEPPTEPVPVKKEEKRNVNVTEHLMSIPDVASKFNVSIDEAKPASSIELVNGDVVLKMGDKIPADVFIFASTELKATNLAFNGTLCVNGDGYGIVIRTGDHTVIGQIASLTTNEQRRESPMSVEIDHFVHIIAGVAAVTAAIFFVVAMVGRVTLSRFSQFRHWNFVSFVPEGLPATVTMLLTIAAKRMASRKVLVKDLQGVETLGAITLLATDKTGTLTRNQMTVTYIWTGGQLIPEDGFEPVALDANKPGPNEFENTNVPIAELGLLRCAAAKIPEFDSIHERHPKVFEIPFNSTNKWAMTSSKRHSNGQLMLYIKARLNPVTLTPEHKAQFENTYTYMASKGHRVLAFAALALPGDQYPADHEFKKEAGNYPTKDYTFYGLVSLEDPPKHGVREAIGHCRAAGIKVMMVTGDHPLTAEAIARKINLMLSDTRETLAKKRQCPPESIPESDARAIVIHGEMIDTLKEEDWVNIFDKDEIIFARTSPSHKLQIVKRAQARGHIVGVTGDAVSRKVALSSRTSRSPFNTLCSQIFCTLPSHSHSLCRLNWTVKNARGTSLRPRTVGKRDMRVTRTRPTMRREGGSLAWKRRMRRRLAGTIETIGCFAAYFFAFWYHYRITPAIAVQHGTNFALEGYSTRVFGSDGRELLFDDQKKALGQAQSAFYLALMLQQSFNLFVCKARLGYPFGKFMFQNKYSFLGLFAGAALTFAMVYIPPLNVAFGTDYQLTPLSWLVGIGGGILLFLYVVLRTLLKKIFNPIKYADEVVGLQMFPTKWSTGR
ncbi:hypothetical protein BC829DRAFT_390250 [Chytridium lagenaria]|nr:hypothetical protein BC829DRAFT_390250 [Chytridium lagenaria]